jgi:CheY-like chemotaxis protein
MAGAPTILVIDDDRDVARLVEAVLTDEGYNVAQLHMIEPDLVVRAVGQLEPDCVLLDGQSPQGFGDSWALAESLAVRSRPVPVVMFTAHGADQEEAREAQSARSVAAHFAAVLGKPFDLDELMAAVRDAVGHSVPFDRSLAADARRTRVLAAELEAAGATEVRRSQHREWVICRAPSGRCVQLYWWQLRGLYLCGAYDSETGSMVPIGEFPDRDLAVACTLAA